MSKWILTDPVTSATYSFPHNPATMSTTVAPHTTTTYGSVTGVRAFRKGDVPTNWSFGGWLRTKGEYDALVAWAARPNAIHVTDHRGQVHEVIPVTFEPVPRRSGRWTEWNFTYAFKALYVRRVA